MNIVLIGIFGFIAYELLAKGHAATAAGSVPVGNAAPRPAGATTPLQSGPLMQPPTQQGIAAGEFNPGGGGGGAGGTVPTYRPANYGGYDPFNTDFFNGTGAWGGGGQTYKQQYPVPPGVIDVGGGDGLDIGLDYDY